MPTPQVLMAGISFGESPRWHDGRLWFADWGAGELIAVDSGGMSEVVARIDSFPSSPRPIRPCCARSRTARSSGTPT